MNLQQIRSRFYPAMRDRISALKERQTWGLDRIERHQARKLRHLLAHAKERSPFHAKRLRAVDPDTFELDQLCTLPVMTKAEMMASFDDVVTDRRISRAKVEEHLASCGKEAKVLEEEFFAIRTGGSTGLKGMFVYPWDGMVEYFAQMNSHVPPPESGTVVALVLAPNAAHVSGLGGSLFDNPQIDLIRAPVTLPLEEIVRRLNKAQPHLVFSYPSILSQLAIEQQAQRLSIKPRALRTAAEQLLPADRRRIETAFGVPILDTFACCEGVFGEKAPGEEAFTFANDLAIVELVDERYQPVSPGTESALALITNLFNTAQPLIRYALEDRFRRLPDSPKHGHMIATVEGRASKPFHYGTVSIHPVVFATVIDSSEVLDYQIRQTSSGANIRVVATDKLDLRDLASSLQSALRDAGLQRPQVQMQLVTALPRDPQTGKVQRLAPLAPTPPCESKQAAS